MRILLATDGSEFSVEAAKQCGKLAANIENAKIKIVYALDSFTPMAAEPFVTSEEFLENIETQMRENAQNNISEAVRILHENDRVFDYETEILIGLPKKLIVKEAEKWKADLIIVGSHGHGFWGRNFLGSVSDAIVHHAPCSVLVAKRKELFEKDS